MTSFRYWGRVQTRRSSIYFCVLSSVRTLYRFQMVGRAGVRDAAWRLVSVVLVEIIYCTTRTSSVCFRIKRPGPWFMPLVRV